MYGFGVRRESWCCGTIAEQWRVGTAHRVIVGGEAAIVMRYARVCCRPATSNTVWLERIRRLRIWIIPRPVPVRSEEYLVTHTLLGRVGGVVGA